MAHLRSRGMYVAPPDCHRDQKMKAGPKAKVNPKLMTGMHGAPAAEEPPEQSVLRGRIFTDLDRLAFALEMEAARSLDDGDTEAANRLQNQRLGVRLAQRLVTAHWAGEVNERLLRWESEYRARLKAAGV